MSVALSVQRWWNRDFSLQDTRIDSLPRANKNRFSCYCTLLPSLSDRQTQGWNAVADAGGVPVWAAETLAFRGTGNKMKVIGDRF